MRLNRRIFTAAAALASGGCTGRLAAAPVATVAFDWHPTPAIEFANAPAPTQTLAARMQHYHVPGASIAVIRDGRLAWSQAAGVRRANSTERVSERTLFQAASMSKPVAAVGALLLVNAGAVGLDEDISARVRSWGVEFADGVAQGRITLRGLLSHTAGVSVPSYPGFAPGAALPSLRAILAGAAEANSSRVEIAHPPGSFRYSGGGYEIVEQLVEELTGRSFADYMRRTVFDPIGMRSSTFAPLPPTSGADVAAGHSWTGELREHPWLIYPQHAAAGLWSTPNDLARFLCAIVASLRGDPGALLSRELARTLCAEVAGGRGVGFAIEGEGAAQTISHDGWNEGYVSFMAAFPASGDGVVVMANADRGFDFSMEVVRGVARGLNWRLSRRDGFSSRPSASGSSTSSPANIISPRSTKRPSLHARAII